MGMNITISSLFLDDVLVFDQAFDIKMCFTWCCMFVAEGANALVL